MEDMQSSFNTLSSIHYGSTSIKEIYSSLSQLSD